MKLFKGNLSDNGQSRPLSRLVPGDVALVKAVLGSNAALCSKLSAMGVVAGTEIEFVALAPLGDPIEIRVFGCRLALRRSEADMVEVVLKQAGGVV